MVTRSGREVYLAPKEFDLLWELLRHDGAVVSRLQLIREVWGYPDSVLTRTVDTHIGELRKKLEQDPANPEHILTVRQSRLPTGEIAGNNEEIRNSGKCNFAGRL